MARKATDSSDNEKKKPVKKSSSGKSWKYFRVTLIIICVGALLGGIVAGLWLMQHALFSGNPRFTLRNIEVRGSGWWDGRSNLISAHLNLRPGKDNLFSLDLNNLRKELRKIPSVETATVSRQLPDTLKINLLERIPRAFLGSSTSPWVVDSSCVIMPKVNCIDISTQLPVILGYYKKVHAGAVVPELKSALELLRLVDEHFPEIKIQGLSVSDPDQLRFFMVWKDNPNAKYKVFMPHTNLRTNLTVLRSNIIQTQRTGDPRRTIDLNYKETVILK